MLPVKNSSEIVLYQPDNSISIEALLEDETIWLTLDNLSVLYGRNKSTISRHIKNIFKEGELAQYSVVANFATTASDGKTYMVNITSELQSKTWEKAFSHSQNWDLRKR